MRSCIVLCVWLFIACAARAAVYYVSQDGTGDFSTIQAGVNAVTAGDTLVVRGDQAAWTDPVTISTRVVILGQGSGCSGVWPTQRNNSFNIQAGGAGTVISGFAIFYSASAITLQTGATGVIVRRCRIVATGTGTSVNFVQNMTNGSITLEECSLMGGTNGQSILVSGGANVVSVVARNCVICMRSGASNSRAVNLGTSSASLTFINCIFLDYPTMFSASGAANWTVDHCVFWNTTWDGTWLRQTFMGDYNAISPTMTNFPGTNNITLANDPFTAYAAPFDPCVDDLHLTAGSGLIDAGDSTAAPDRDGSRRDIGAYGGPLSYEPSGFPDFPFVTNFVVTPDVPQNGVLEFQSTGQIGRGE